MSSISAVLEEGTLFVRGKVAEGIGCAASRKRKRQTHHTSRGYADRQTAPHPGGHGDFIRGLEPRKDSKETARTFGISCSANGWFTEKHPKLDPVATMTEGIYIAGCAQGPKDIPASVAQGAAAAARVLGKIEQKAVALEPIRASVVEERCSGCRICNGLCPFNAITFHEDRMVTEINPALCQGCGTCVAACPQVRLPAQASATIRFMAQIEGLMMLNVEPEPVAA